LNAIGLHGLRIGRIAEGAGAVEYVCKRVARGFHLEALAPSRRHRDVEITRLGGNTVNGSALSIVVADDHAHERSIIFAHDRDLQRRHILVTRIRHLERARQIGPQLKTVHASGGIALRHLLVENAAARCHPLHIAGAELAAIAEAVAVVDFTGEHIGNGFDSAMRMPRKSRHVIGRPLVAKIVEQQERIELIGLAKTECAAQAYTRALHGQLGLTDTLNGTNRHRLSSVSPQR
jgi:hypothetical protein